MVGIQYLALAAAALQIVSANTVGEDWPLQLLKRQEPGTNSYRCHDTCGQAIIGSRSSGYCTSTTFTTNYANCLVCAGSDNVNIWTMYGTALTGAATTCGGLSTTPLSGKQPDIPDAIPASGGVTPSASSPSLAVASSSVVPTTASSTPTATSGSNIQTTAASTSSPTAPGSSTIKSSSSAIATFGSVGVTSTSISPSGVAQGSSSATTSSGGVAFTGAASNVLPTSVAIFAAAALMVAGMMI